MTQLLTPTDIHILSPYVDVTLLGGSPRFVRILEIPEEECVWHPFPRNWQGRFRSRAPSSDRLPDVPEAQTHASDQQTPSSSNARQGSSRRSSRRVHHRSAFETRPSTSGPSASDARPSFS